jgi:integrase
MSKFMSSLASEFEAFLKYKRALGCRYSRAEYTLREFDRFVAQQDEQVDPARFDRVLGKWLARTQGRKSVSVTNELGVIRQFCLWRRRTDPTGFVPGREWAAQSTESTFFPHIFTIEEIRKLLRLTRSLSRPDFLAPMYRALLLVLYCTGLRFGEAMRLRIRHVDTDGAVIFVADSKGRSRWVPFDRSLARELESYLLARREYARSEPDDLFFVGHDRHRLPVVTASVTIRELLRTAGLKPKSGRVGPRPYDLRHTFAVHRLTRWYRAGVDVHTRLPWLSAYMGHKDILGTETYLSATPELLEMAARRFHRRLSRRRGR